MTDDPAANQLGNDLSIHLMLRMVFEILGGMANDPDKFRVDITDQLVDLANTVALPPMPAETEPKIRAVMTTIISGLLSNVPPETPLTTATYSMQ
jgi:hypothetical protein